MDEAAELLRKLDVEVMPQDEQASEDQRVGEDLQVGQGQQAGILEQGQLLLEMTRRRRGKGAYRDFNAVDTVSGNGANESAAPCFEIDAVVIVGNTVVRDDQFAPAFDEFSDRCLRQPDIGILLERISAIYADAGFITSRAYLPPQDLADRRLLVEILEGRIESYEYEQVDKAGVSRPGPAWKMGGLTFQEVDSVLQLRDLEDGIEQLNRLRSSEAAVRLDAGEMPGSSRVVVWEAKSDTIRGIFGYERGAGDNATPALAIARLEMDDLLRFNDSWSLSFSGSRNSNSAGFSLSLPYRLWLFSTGFSYSEEFETISESAYLFSQTASANTSLERRVFRDATSRHFVNGTLESYWNERYVNIVPLTPQHRSVVRLGHRYELRSGRFAFDANATLTLGARFLDADWDRSGIGPDEPRADFGKIGGRLALQRELGDGQRFSASLVGQVANAALFSNEQLSVGGWGSVRGYAGHAFSGDNGVYARTEFLLGSAPVRLCGRGGASAFADGARTAVPAEFPDSGVRDRPVCGGFAPFVFADAGYARSRASGKSAVLTGLGLGMSAQAGLVSASSSIAIPGRGENGQRSGAWQAILRLEIKAF